MCARYTLYHPKGMLATYFAALSDETREDESHANAQSREEPPEDQGGSESRNVLVVERSAADLEPNYNIAPTNRVVVILDNGARVIRLMRWGLLLHWSGQRGSKPLVNARAETLLEKVSFREATRNRRCIVPASGFYEWKKVGKERLPYYIHRRDGEPMAFAGLWEPWKSPDGPAQTCAIVTVAANGLISPLHDRMPAILPRDDEDAWLNCTHTPAETAIQLLRPCPEKWVEMHPVSSRMNRQIVNDPDCIAPMEHSRNDILNLFDEGHW